MKRGLISLCNDGIYTSMWPVQTKSIIGSGKLSIYPNPTLDEFSVNLTDNEFELTLDIYDGQGKLMQGLKKVEGKSRLNFGRAYPPGMYFIRIRYKNSFQSIKLIKLRND